MDTMRGLRVVDPCRLRPSERCVSLRSVTFSEPLAHIPRCAEDAHGPGAQKAGLRLFAEARLRCACVREMPKRTRGHRQARVGAQDAEARSASAGRRLAKAVVGRLPVTHLANLLCPKPRWREVMRAHGMGRVADALPPVRRLPVDPVAPPGRRLRARMQRHGTPAS